MSSTKTDSDKTLTEVFEKEFVRAAEQLREAGISPLEIGFDDALSSYYVKRKKLQLERKDFELDLDDPEDIKRRFRQGWSEAEAKVLEGLVDKILALANVCDEVEQSTDVSPFVYAMF